MATAAVAMQTRMRAILQRCVHTPGCASCVVLTAATSTGYVVIMSGLWCALLAQAWGGYGGMPAPAAAPSYGGPSSYGRSTGSGLAIGS